MRVERRKKEPNTRSEEGRMDRRGQDMTRDAEMCDNNIIGLMGTLLLYFAQDFCVVDSVERCKTHDQDRTE